MATNITVYIGAMDVSSYVRDVYIWRRQNRFQIKMWNPNGILSGVIAADATVQVYLDGLPFFKGYVDNVQPTIRETDEACFEHTLTVSGRDISQDMWNKVWDKIYHGKADDIIQDILTSSGCEVTFTSSSTAPIIYYDCRQMFVGDAIREILELIDYDGYVDWNKQLHIFPIGTVSSGITLTAVKGGTQNNIIKIVEHVEKDATDLKNYIIVLGGAKNAASDAWTEHTAGEWQISPSSKWALTDVEFPSELGGYLSGIAAVKAYRTQTPQSDKGDVVFTLSFPRFNKDYLAWDKLNKEDLVFTTAVKANIQMSGILRVRLTDVNNKVVYTSNYIPGSMGGTEIKWETNSGGAAKPQVWVFPVGKDVKINSDQSYWRGDSDFNWQVKTLEIIFCGANLTSTTGGNTYCCLEIYLDGLTVPAPEGESPIVAVAQDANSQNLYKVRKAFYNKKDIKTQVLLQQFATSLLNKRKNPLERLRLQCLGSVGKISNAWNWIPGINVTVNIPDEEINNKVYRMIEVIHRLGIETMQTYGYDHVVELSLVPYNQPVDLTRWSYETGEIGIFRSLHERLSYLEQEKSERRDWFTALPLPLAVHTEDVKIPIYQPVFGETAAGTLKYSASANQLLASKFSLTTSYDEKPAFISVYVKAAATPSKLKVAVYADSSNYPAALLDWSEFITVPANFDGQVIIPLTQNKHLSAGDYWLAVWCSAAIQIYAKTGSSKLKTVTFNGFPDPFPSGASTASYLFSVYYGVFSTKTVADWQDKTYPDKIDTDALSRPTEVLVGGYVDETLEKPVITVVSEELDTSTVFRTWLRVTIQRIADAVGYIISYRKEGVAEWTQFYVSQPSSGNPEAVTVDLEENTYYEVKAAAVYPNSKVSGWCTVQTVQTQTNNTPPDAPVMDTPTAVIDGVLLTWSKSSALDFQFYKVYYGTTNPPTSLAGQASQPYFFWKKKPTEAYTTYYFAVSAVDVAGNESSKSTAVSAAPLQVKPLDLTIESRPWTADCKFESVTNQSLPSGLFKVSSLSDGDVNVKFADGTTETFPKTSFTFVNNIGYVYWNKSTQTLAYTDTYSDAVGSNKGLLAITQADVSSSTQVRYFANRNSDVGGYLDFSLANTTSYTMLTAEKDLGTTPRVGVRIRKYNNGSPITVVDWTEVIPSTTLSELTIDVSIPSTSFDRLIVDLRARVDNITNSASFITEPLNVTVGGNVTFKVWARRTTVDTAVYVFVYFGSVSYNSRLTNMPLPTLSKTPTILPFNSYSPTIGAGVISAKSILSEHIQSGQITTDLLAANAVTADKIASGAVVSDKIYAGAVTADKIAAGAVTTDKLYSGAVTADKIAAGQVNTDHIRFNSLTSDPSYEAGKMWWRSDVDQLRFASGTTLDKIAIIPKYPLFDVQAPPENLIPNQSFEIDRDGNGIPDFWTQPGTGNYGLSTTSLKGKYAVYLRMTANTWGEWTSQMVPCRAGAKLYASAWVRVLEDGQYYSPNVGVVHIAYYDADKQLIGETPSVVNPITTIWTLHEVSDTAPSNTKYVAVHLYVGNTISPTILFDDVVLSEIRATAPTTRIVAQANSGYIAGFSLGTDWSTVVTINPSDDTEIFYIQFLLEAISGIIPTRQIWIYIRAEVDGISYPSSNGIVLVGVFTQESVSVFWPYLIVIPRNLKGKTVYVKAKMYGQTDPVTIYYQYYYYGVSPHYHR